MNRLVRCRLVKRRRGACCRRARRRAGRRHSGRGGGKASAWQRRVENAVLAVAQTAHPHTNMHCPLAIETCDALA